MEMLTTYRVKGKTIGLEFLFKYDLNGNLKAFEIAEGELEENQINWLFKGYLPKETNDPLPFNSKKGLNQYLMISIYHLLKVLRLYLLMKHSF